MKSIILSAKFDDTHLEVHLSAPASLMQGSIKDLPQPDQQIVWNMATCMEWLKMCAKKNNQQLSMYINEKLVVDQKHSPDITVN